VQFLGSKIKEEIKNIQRNGVKVDGAVYKFQFSFTSDLKFLWAVSDF
jgi:hypothetical protein